MAFSDPKKYWKVMPFIYFKRLRNSFFVYAAILKFPNL